MDIDETLVREIVRRVVAVADPERIILFGSAAAGEMSPDSDIDLLVLMSGVYDAHGESVRIRQALRGLGYAFDIIVMRDERFEESKDVIGGIAFPAHRYGRVVYEAA